MKSLVLCTVFLLATLTTCANPQVAREISWNTSRAQAETAGFLKDLIRLDTRNPPGNESSVAHYLGQIFAREGIPYEFLEIEPGRASIVARLTGDGSKRPLLILGHEDVVPVEKAQWTVDPFAGLERDGVIYGRGAFDDKAMVAANLEVMLELKRRSLPLARDVIFLAEAGEETGGGSGMAQLIERYWSKIDCEFALNEGEGAGLKDGKVAYMTVATSQKIERRARLIAHGTSGHGSVPRLDNPVVHLASAVAALGTWETPARLNDTSDEYFRRIAEIIPAEEREWYSDPLSPSSEAAFRIHHPEIYSMLRTSIVPTMLNAGVKINLIPSTAEAALDIRALPDEDPAALFASLAQVIKDPNIEIVPEDAKPRPSPPPSSLSSEMFAALEYAQRVIAPSAITLPLMTNSGSDSAFLRAKGVQAYGITVPKTEAEMATHHGNDERIGIEQLGLFTRYLWTAVTRTALR